MSENHLNWSGHHTYGAATIHHPTTLAEVQAIVAAATKVRGVGSRHSFNGIADSPGDLISLEHLNKVLAIDPARRTATVEGGINYIQLGPQLDRAGFALRNLASLPHISVAGACATATHGSGDRNGNLATAVSAIEFVAPSGDLVTLSREHDGGRFAGAVVSLGALGIVTKLTLDLVPTYRIAQVIYDDLPLATVLEQFDAIMSSAYSVSLFTDWQGMHINQTWVKRLVTDDPAPAPEPTFFGATAADSPRRPASKRPAAGSTPQHGVPGPWHERVPHFRPEGVAPVGKELQTEYFVPRQHAVAAVRAIAALGERLAPVLLIAEVRTIAADDLWLSTCYGRDGVGFHFTWHQDWSKVEAVLPALEEALAPFAARPHWGKLFTMSPARVQALYPCLAEFRALLRHYDPAGKFSNDYVERFIFGEA
ncbi:MAG TPA: D-arabinono-1,4-lactone oxidase [Thermomicrobiales bacterium]